VMRSDRSMPPEPTAMSIVWIGAEGSRRDAGSVRLAGVRRWRRLPFDRCRSKGTRNDGFYFPSSFLGAQFACAVPSCGSCVVLVASWRFPFGIPGWRSRARCVRVGSACRNELAERRWSGRQEQWFRSRNRDELCRRHQVSVCGTGQPSVSCEGLDSCELAREWWP
jgi:hypothetical protein